MGNCEICRCIIFGPPRKQTRKNMPAKRRGPYLKHVYDGDIPRTSKWRLLAHRGSEKSTLESLSSQQQQQQSDDRKEPTLVTTDDLQGDLLENFDESSEGIFESVTINDISESEEEFSVDEGDTEESCIPEIHDDAGQRCNTADCDEKDEPLFLGSRLTLGVSMLLIITFAMKHGLSGTALSDLLTLVELHCPTVNIFKKSWQIFRAFFTKLKSPLQFHYYCMFCSSYIGLGEAQQCANCNSKDVSYFLVIPLMDQIQSLFSRQGIGAQILATKARSSQWSDADAIEDVTDGKLYRECLPDGFLCGTELHRKGKEIHISFQFNTDGVALFKSSKFSVWPIYLVVNELPPKERFSRENRLFVGLWFGKKKPMMNVYLTPLVEELRFLYNTGVTVMVERKKTLLRAMLLSIVCDAPARCMVQNFTQFNGFYGCPSCLSKGESVKTSERGTTLVYPYDTSEETKGHAELRSHNSCLKYARTAESDDKTYFGVKGFSVLYHLPLFNIVRGVTVDYMHCVLLGVMKMLIHLWIDIKHKVEPFYIGSYLDVLNDRILSIQPPRIITRAPRSFTDLPHWKASEYRSFLLFYSVVCLWGILPDEYLQHFMLFVSAIFSLLQSKITRRELTVAKLSLAKFCAQFDYMYNVRYQSSNLHSLLHLCHKVEDLGPLWSHSCFFYEDLNGDLRSLFHGTQAIQMQITLAVSVQQQIPILSNSIVPGSSAETLFTRMRKRFVQNNRHQTDIDDNTFLVGTSKKCKLSVPLATKIEKKFGKVVDCHQFFRLLSQGVMYHSKQYKCVSRRNSYTIQYSKKSKRYFGLIEYYLKCCFSDSVKYFAVLKKLKVQRSDLLADQQSIKHLVPVKMDASSSPVLVKYIKEPCVYITVKDVEQAFVASFPNFVENE